MISENRNKEDVINQIKTSFPNIFFFCSVNFQRITDTKFREKLPFSMYMCVSGGKNVSFSGNFA